MRYPIVCIGSITTKMLKNVNIGKNSRKHKFIRWGGDPHATLARGHFVYVRDVADSTTMLFDIVPMLHFDPDLS